MGFLSWIHMSSFSHWIGFSERRHYRNSQIFCVAFHMTAVEGQPARLSKSSQEAYQILLSKSRQLQFPSGYINGCNSNHRGNAAYYSAAWKQGHNVVLLSPPGLKGYSGLPGQLQISLQLSGRSQRFCGEGKCLKTQGRTICLRCGLCSWSGGWFLRKTGSWEPVDVHPAQRVGRNPLQNAPFQPQALQGRGQDGLWVVTPRSSRCRALGASWGAPPGISCLEPLGEAAGLQVKERTWPPRGAVPGCNPHRTPPARFQGLSWW